MRTPADMYVRTKSDSATVGSIKVLHSARHVSSVERHRGDTGHPIKTGGAAKRRVPSGSRR